MIKQKVYTAIGLMSGTSLDGVDAALIRTDGKGSVMPIGFLSEAYTPDLKQALRKCFGQSALDDAGLDAERQMTLVHARLVKQLMATYPKEKVDIIGFHGQTILHDIGNRCTVQIGDAPLLANETGIDVIYDFRSDDVEAGGQGAPLAPMYHAARVYNEKLKRPVALLNIGGVSNITWIGNDENHIVAFDTGTGNALMDDYVKNNLSMDYDPDGAFAANGQADEIVLYKWMTHAYFNQKPPKSLDRNQWDIAALGPMATGLIGLSPEDALATLLEFTVQGVQRALDFVPTFPQTMYVSGGGRHNSTLMKRLNEVLPFPVMRVDDMGWDGDATEAECFAYLAVRNLLGYPISLPETTGVPEPLSGGRFVKAA